MRIRLFSGFSLVEILVVVALMAILSALLLPVLGKARDSARHTAWSAMSSSTQSDPRLALYYDFQGQAGDEISSRGEPIVSNKSTGDPMGLVASKESLQGANDPTMRYAAIRESHPDDDTKGYLPEFQDNKGRFRASSAMYFDAEHYTLDDLEPSNGSNKIHGTSYSVNYEGGYLMPDYWAGIVDKGEFQIGMWVKLEDTLAAGALAVWGSQEGISYDGEEPGNWFRWAYAGPGYGASVYNRTRGLTIKKQGPGSITWIANDSDQNKTAIIQDNQWHFVVLRLQKPYNRLAPGLNGDPSIPEMDDVELSIDGSEFKRATNFWGYSNSEDKNRRIERKVNTLAFGANYFWDETGTKWNQNDFIRGYIDEIMVWQEPTSEDEIKRMYRTGAPLGHHSNAFKTGAQAKAELANDGVYGN